VYGPAKLRLAASKANAILAQMPMIAARTLCLTVACSWHQQQRTIMFHWSCRLSRTVGR
jgi:hypothetical protein